MPITVPQLSEPTRLDKYLLAELPGWSRTALQQAIKDGKIKVNQKNIPPHHFLKAGEVIDINVEKTLPVPTQKPYSDINFKIIKETDDYVVIEKPSGLVVHPAPGVKETTIIESLLKKYPEIADVGDDKTRPGVVHRLDRDVSGLLVVARTNKMFESLKQQFQERKVHKIYTALVIGKLTKPSGTINFPIAKSKEQHGKMVSRPQADDKTREAVTHFEVIKNYQQATLLKITLETGRTHQIRTHLSALGYPLVGDKLYHPKKMNFKANPGRIFLHATELAFSDLENNWQTFSSPLPEILTNFLKQLV